MSPTDSQNEKSPRRGLEPALNPQKSGTEPTPKDSQIDSQTEKQPKKRLKHWAVGTGGRIITDRSFLGNPPFTLYAKSLNLNGLFAMLRHVLP